MTFLNRHMRSFEWFYFYASNKISVNHNSILGINALKKILMNIYAIGLIQ